VSGICAYVCMYVCTLSTGPTLRFRNSTDVFSGL
jgi:hypothetical protein